MAQETEDVALAAARGEDELDMVIAIDNFGSFDAANDALAVVVRTARSEMDEADDCRASADWLCLARWVHRTRGVLVLFGAPALRRLGEQFEEQSWGRTHADEAFETYRIALVAWLVHAEIHLVRSGTRL